MATSDLLGPAVRVDFIAALAALFGVLVFDTLPGLFIGIGVFVIVLFYRSSRPTWSGWCADPHPPAGGSITAGHPTSRSPPTSIWSGA